MCETMTSSDTAARCGNACSGGCSAEARGSMAGSMVLPERVVQLQRNGCAPNALGSGSWATEASRAIGTAEAPERCAACQVGQGDDCTCWRPMPLRTVRAVLAVSCIAWVVIVAAAAWWQA